MRNDSECTRLPTGRSADPVKLVVVSVPIATKKLNLGASRAWHEEQHEAITRLRNLRLGGRNWWHISLMYPPKK